MLIALLMVATASLGASPRIPDPPCFTRDAHGTPAPCAEPDAAVIRTYATWPAHGRARRHVRFSIGTAATRVKVGARVRILHVMESLDKSQLWVMGPKAVYGLTVDGKLRGTLGPNVGGSEPWLGETYDGAVEPGPGLDTNFEISEFLFETPGRHTVVWHVGAWTSNTLVFTVVP